MALRKRFKNARQNRKVDGQGLGAHEAHLEAMRKKFCQKTPTPARPAERPSMTRAAASADEASIVKFI